MTQYKKYMVLLTVTVVEIQLALKVMVEQLEFVSALVLNLGPSLAHDLFALNPCLQLKNIEKTKVFFYI